MRLNFSDVFKFHYILGNVFKNITNFLQKSSSRITLSIVKNRTKIWAVAFEFIANGETDRRGGGRFYIICSDKHSFKVNLPLVPLIVE